MTKRILSFLLALCLIIGAVPVFATAAFSDVPSSHWAEDAIRYAVKQQYMNGIGNNKFDPNGNITRAQLVEVLFRLEDGPGGKISSVFTDVNQNAYYFPAVLWAADNGIVTGKGGGKFAPNDPITREQIAAILYRYAGYKGFDRSKRASLNKYQDSSRISSYALTPMRWANAEGLIAGTSFTAISPGGNASRAQLAVILMRFCENIVRPAYENDSGRIPITCTHDGEDIFTVYLPSRWRDTYRVSQSSDPQGTWFGISLHDKANYDAGWGGHVVSFMGVSDDSYMMTVPNCRVLEEINIHEKKYTILQREPTDVQFGYDDKSKTNSYLRKCADIKWIAKSITYSDGVSRVE